MDRLRKLRGERHLNQQRLAIELNVTQAAISKYELGVSEPDIAMLKNTANFFHVSVDYLIGFSDVPSQCISSDIPAEDAKPMNKYRQLNDIQKAKVQAYIQGLLQE